MKTIAALCLVLAVAQPAVAAKPAAPSKTDAPSAPAKKAAPDFERRISVGIDFVMLGERLGWEAPLGHRFRWKADMGMSFAGIFTFDAFAVLPLLRKDSVFQLDLLAGIPNFAVHFRLIEGMIALGGGVRIGIRFPSRLRLSLRLGAGFPLFIGRGDEVISRVKVWPDACLELSIPIDF
jgi:hypothetical protein